jgi:hypothetical protein
MITAIRTLKSSAFSRHSPHFHGQQLPDTPSFSVEGDRAFGRSFTFQCNAGAARNIDIVFFDLLTKQRRLRNAWQRFTPCVAALALMILDAKLEVVEMYPF